MALKLHLKRRIMTEHFTIGALFANGDFVCHTLEPSIYAVSHPAIQEGVYGVRMYPSTKFKGMRPILIGVKGRSGILIHEGNLPSHTQGCILVGIWNGRGMVEKSRDKLAVVQDMIEHAISRSEDVQIVVSR